MPTLGARRSKLPGDVMPQRQTTAIAPVQGSRAQTTHLRTRRHGHRFGGPGAFTQGPANPAVAGTVPASHRKRAIITRQNLSRRGANTDDVQAWPHAWGDRSLPPFLFSFQ